MLVRLREGKLATRPGRTITLIAFGHSAVDRALDDGRVPCRRACRPRRR